MKFDRLTREEGLLGACFNKEEREFFEKHSKIFEWYSGGGKGWHQKEDHLCNNGSTYRIKRSVLDWKRHVDKTFVTHTGLEMIYFQAGQDYNSSFSDPICINIATGKTKLKVFKTRLEVIKEKLHDKPEIVAFIEERYPKGALEKKFSDWGFFRLESQGAIVWVAQKEGYRFWSLLEDYLRGYSDTCPDIPKKAEVTKVRKLNSPTCESEVIKTLNKIIDYLAKNDDFEIGGE